MIILRSILKKMYFQWICYWLSLWPCRPVYRNSAYFANVIVVWCDCVVISRCSRLKVRENSCVFMVRAERRVSWPFFAIVKSETHQYNHHYDRINQNLFIQFIWIAVWSNMEFPINPIFCHCNQCNQLESITSPDNYDVNNIRFWELMFNVILRFTRANKLLLKWWQQLKTQ